MKSKYYYQQGYGGIEAFLAAVIIGTVMYFYFYPAKFYPVNVSPSGSECFKDPPDSTRTISDGGVAYALLKEKAPITTRQYGLHVNTSAQALIEGKTRAISKAILDSKGVISHSGWKVDDNDFSALDLRFVDVSDTVFGRTPGINYVNVYLKKDAPAPSFISTFCSKKTFIDDIAIFPDNTDSSFPPYTIDLASISDWYCEPTGGSVCADFLRELPKTGIYYVYAFDTPGSFAADFIARTGFFPYGAISLTANGETKTYKTVFGAWEEKYIGIYGPNPQDPTQTVIYRYLRPDFLRLLTNPYLTANPDKIATSSLQLDEFTPFTIAAAGWWTPICKPAVYLYPEKEQRINVQVSIPQGKFLYTDPIYPSSGWDVTAKPNGELYYAGNLSDSKGMINYASGVFPYLYYEARIADSAIQKPTKGFVKKYEELGSFYDDLLPKLGLNAKETQEFREYWFKALPYASYYFIGIIPQDQLSITEPLTITPKQDSMIRVRLYFEALDTPKTVPEPTITTPTRTGFTVVDWGGMVKTDKDHPFTCLQ